MKLIRNVIVAYGGKVNEIEPFDCNIEVGDYKCCIKSLCVWGEDLPLKILLSGEIQLSDHPKVIEDTIQIPKEPRKILESYLEYFADMIAMVNNAKRKLFSPVPTVAFISGSEDDEEFLATNNFPDQLNQKSKMLTNPDLEFGQDLLEKLADRKDGVRLVSEALACRHATGAFHEYIRLFERAFKKGNKDLIEPLQKFLDQAKYDVESDEAKRWINEFRHPSIHADERDFFHIESDIRPIFGRVKQAAFDVLLNKINWRSDDPKRRELWDPEGCIRNPDGTSLTIEYEPNTTKSVNFDPPTTFDMFEAYPVHERGRLTEIPEEWRY